MINETTEIICYELAFVYTLGKTAQLLAKQHRNPTEAIQGEASKIVKLKLESTDLIATIDPLKMNISLRLEVIINTETSFWCLKIDLAIQVLKKITVITATALYSGFITQYDLYSF